jgi:hypothetical protein
MVREPNRSARRPLAGMKIASASRYEVSAELMLVAGTPKSRAIVGNAVASTVESICSMNNAQAMISAVTR